MNFLMQSANFLMYLFYNWYGIIGSPIVAVITLIPAIYGLVKHRSRSNLCWWIIPCAVISVIAFSITVFILCGIATYVGG